MGARPAFVFSRTHSRAHSDPLQTARHANNSFPLISFKCKDSKPRLDAPDLSRQASAGWQFSLKPKGGSR